MSIWDWVLSAATISSFSALLVFGDPLTVLADWLASRRRRFHGVSEGENSDQCRISLPGV